MQIDVEKLALEAGLPAATAKKFRRARGQEMTDAEKKEWAQVERFAALVLEAAALQCEETDRVTFVFAGQTHDDAGGSLYSAAAAIRAMKPGESNE
jgi:hypothetical protein